MSFTVGEEPQDQASPAVFCEACGREASFEARVDARAGQEPVARKANACAGHLRGIAQGLSAWFRENDLAGGLLTISAIGPSAARLLSGSGHWESRGWGSALCTIAIMRPARTALPSRAASAAQDSGRV
jgi:hypothetical protein